MEMLSKDENPENSLLLQCMWISLSPRKLCTSLSCCVAAVWNNEGRLLFILFSHSVFNWGRLHLGEQYNFIFYNFILFLLLLAFHPKVYIVLSRVCMNDYNKFNSLKRTIRLKPWKQCSSAVYANFSELLCSCTLPKNWAFYLCCCVVADWNNEGHLLFILFSHPEFN